MKTVTIKAGKGYEVQIGSGILKDAGERIRKVSNAKKALLVSDDNVFPLYGEKVKGTLENAGFETACFVFHNGEAQKNLKTYGEILEAASKARLSRSDLIVALGGGVTGDMAGFAAATYQRGIGFVQIPTTLLSCIDSSVGGKTAVDLPNGKNQVGAFYQPLLVVIDPTVLETLPDAEYRNGCAEIIKTAVLDGEEITPTHVFLQAGVGAMAGGITARLRQRYGKTLKVVTVEPEEAACLLASWQEPDGLPHTVGGNPRTIMAGLNCGTPCGVVWPVLRDQAFGMAAVSDDVSREGMRRYAHPLGDDRPVVSGESGAATLGFLLEAASDPALRQALGLTASSRILLISTEGDTDPEMYRRIVGDVPAV
ncbi:MAG: pyridoxal-phosphate dependent enzyme [Lachnospiraceae bacterium]|nr:pyridoxal-phosphate dependent enzyme [Lachnospiraceae bacterium]